MTILLVIDAHVCTVGHTVHHLVPCICLACSGKPMDSHGLSWWGILTATSCAFLCITAMSLLRRCYVLSGQGAELHGGCSDAIPWLQHNIANPVIPISLHLALTIQLQLLPGPVPQHTTRYGVQPEQHTPAAALHTPGTSTRLQWCFKYGTYLDQHSLTSQQRIPIQVPIQSDNQTSAHCLTPGLLACFVPVLQS